MSGLHDFPLPLLPFNLTEKRSNFFLKMQTLPRFHREVETAVRQRRHRWERRGREGARVLRGGSWNNNERGHLLSSCRPHYTRGSRHNNCGFRCMMVVR